MMRRPEIKRHGSNATDQTLSPPATPIQSRPCRWDVLAVPALAGSRPCTHRRSLLPCLPASLPQHPCRSPAGTGDGNGSTEATWRQRGPVPHQPQRSHSPGRPLPGATVPKTTVRKAMARKATLQTPRSRGHGPEATVQRPQSVMQRSSTQRLAMPPFTAPPFTAPSFTAPRFTASLSAVPASAAPSSVMPSSSTARSSTAP
jgi:hypothetical protein